MQIKLCNDDPIIEDLVEPLPGSSSFCTPYYANADYGPTVLYTKGHPLCTTSTALMNGHQGSMFYVGADAQDRLMNVLLSTHVVGIQISTIMQHVTTWFDFLWAAEVSD